MSVGIDPNTVDWSDVYRCIGMDPGEPITGQTKLITAITLSDQVPIEDEEEAAEFITDALERDGLSRTARGYVIDEHDDRDGDADPADNHELQQDTSNEKKEDGSGEVGKLRDKVARLEAQNRQLNQILRMLIGKRDLSAVEPDKMRPLLDRMQTLEKRVGDIEENNEQRIQLSEMSYSRPDERAQKLRQALVNHAGSEGRAALTRDDVDAILGGLHKGSILEAMKRAADGRLASDSDRKYSPIDGASGLSPVDAITFEVAKGQDDQSRIVLDGNDLTGFDTRQNLMTGGEG